MFVKNYGMSFFEGRGLTEGMERDGVREGHGEGGEKCFSVGDVLNGCSLSEREPPGQHKSVTCFCEGRMERRKTTGQELCIRTG